MYPGFLIQYMTKPKQEYIDKYIEEFGKVVSGC